MASLQPILSGGSDYIRPTQQSATGLQGVVSVLSGILGNVGSAPEVPKPTAKELTNTALTPYANEIADIYSSDLNPDQVNKAVNNVIRKASRERPEYASEIAQLREPFGVSEPVAHVSLPDTVQKNIQTWVTDTAEGRLALARSSVMLADGSGVDYPATYLKLEASYNRYNAESAEMASRKNQLEALEGDEKQRKLLLDRTARELLPDWNKTSVEQVTGMINAAQSGDSKFDTAEEQIAFVNELAYFQEEHFRAKATELGFSPEQRTTLIAEAMQPIKNFQKLVNATGNTPEDRAELLTLSVNMQKLGLERELISVMPALAFPEVRAAMGSQLIQAAVLGDPDAARRVVERLKDFTEGNKSYTSNVFPSIPNSETEATEAANGDIITPEAADKVRRELETNPNAVQENLDTSLTIIEGFTGKPNDPKQSKAVVDSVAQVINYSEGAGGALGTAYLDRFFSNKGLRVLAEVAKAPTQEGMDLKNILIMFATKQIRINEQILADNPVVPQQGQSKRNGGTMQSPEGQKAVKNLALIRSGMSRIIPEFNSGLDLGKQSKEPSNSSTGSRGRVVPDSTQGSQGNDPIANPGTLLSLIDKKEGGGDYDTLFGFSNRDGKAFAGYKVSTKTIGELKSFANGRYGSWVTEKIGYKATPMGRYQFVGSTLASTAKAMGLPDDTVFTPEVQDAMFNFKVKERLKNQKTAEGKRNALRQEWEGFKIPANASQETRDRLNAELDAAIASFESGEPMSFASYDTPQSNLTQYASTNEKKEEVVESVAAQVIADAGGFIYGGGESDVEPVEVPQEAPQPSPEGQGTSGGAKVAQADVERLSAQSRELLKALGVSDDALTPEIIKYLKEKGVL